MRDRESAFARLKAAVMTAQDRIADPGCPPGANVEHETSDSPPTPSLWAVAT